MMHRCEESGLFDEVRHYENYDETLAQMVLELKPKKIALDFSEGNAFCNRMTMGKYEKFVQSLGDFTFEACSADLLSSCGTGARTKNKENRLWEDTESVMGDSGCVWHHNSDFLYYEDGTGRFTGNVIIPVPPANRCREPEKHSG